MNDDTALSRLFLEYEKNRSLTRYDALLEAFSKAWCMATAALSQQDAWTAQNPSLGQCAVTALCVQDICGGTLLRTVVADFGSHYFNHLHAGTGVGVYDLTAAQFPVDTDIPQGLPVDRDYILDSPRAIEARTRERYDLLRSRLADVLRRG